MARNTSDFFDVEDPVSRDPRPHRERRLRQPQPRREPGDEPGLRAQDEHSPGVVIHGSDITPRRNAAQPRRRIKTKKPGAVVIGKKITLARDRLRLRQTDLAYRLGVEQSAVSNWERGLSVPELKSRIKLAAALEIPLTELMPDAGEIEPDVFSNPQVQRIVESFVALAPSTRLAIEALLLDLHRRDRRK
jgi:transcriptional regulator with XRE-family HTH domain